MLMGTTPSGTQTRYNLVRLSTGMVFGATVVACLLSIVAWYPTAFFDMFAVHAVVAFLARDDASFITGATLGVNGGQYMVG